MCAGRPVFQSVKEKNGSRRRSVRLRLSKNVGSRAGRSRSAARFRAMTPCRNTAISLLRRSGGADGLQVCRVVDHLFRLSARAFCPRQWTLCVRFLIQMPLHLPLLSAPRAHVIGQGKTRCPRRTRSGDRSDEIHSICRLNPNFVRF